MQNSLSPGRGGAFAQRRGGGNFFDKTMYYNIYKKCSYSLYYCLFLWYNKENTPFERRKA